MRLAECHPDRKHLARGLCKQCYDKWQGSRSRARRNEAARRWAKANLEKIRSARRRYLYGLDDATYIARANAQDFKCKVCLVGPPEHIDHDHETGKARGLLCGHCNRGLGLFRDDPDRLRRAAQYLELWK